MQRREFISGIGAVVGTVTLAGCAEEVGEIVGEATEEASGEAEGEVNETLEGLARPPDADIQVLDDGTIAVLSLGTDTVGVKCGLIETENPIAEVQQDESAVTSSGQELEDCEDEPVVAVNEAGETAIVAQV